MKNLPYKFGHWVIVCKENVSEYERSVMSMSPMGSSENIHKMLRERILSEDVERMYVVCLDGRSRVKMLHEVSRGGLHGCSMSARDILRIPVMCAASAFVLVHNHPSGDPTPSPEDIGLTRKVIEASGVMGIPLVDHVIIGGMESYASMFERGLM